MHLLPGSTIDNVALSSADGRVTAQGVLCFAEDDGNAVQWLWIEVLAFQASVLTMVVVLMGSFLKATVMIVPKQPNMIVCHDYSDVDPRYPKGQHHLIKYYIFNELMEELYPRSCLVSESFYGGETAVLRKMANKAAPDQEDKDLIAKRYFYLEKFFGDGRADRMSWFRLKSQDINHELRKSIQDTDLLTVLFSKVDFDRVHVFMLIASVLLYAAVDFIYPTSLEFQTLIKAAQETKGWVKPVCAQIVPESNFRSALAPLMVYHCVAILWSLVQPYLKTSAWSTSLTISQFCCSVVFMGAVLLVAPLCAHLVDV